MSLHGFLNVRKPKDLTSFAVVRLVRSRSGVRRVGHAGTLDPLATGVLPICLGHATRLAELVVESPKLYTATIVLGTATDTYDATGTVTEVGEVGGLTRERIEAALPSFRGLIQQTPPMYSALKRQGKRLYELARAGIVVERESRPVAIFRLELVDWTSPALTVAIECGRGAYIRSLAHDLGQTLGCGGHLAELLRLRSGPFTLEDSVTLDALQRGFATASWQHWVRPLDFVLQEWPKITLTEAEERRLLQGQWLTVERWEGEGEGAPPQPPLLRAYTKDGQLLGLLRREVNTKIWQPFRVFPRG